MQELWLMADGVRVHGTGAVKSADYIALAWSLNFALHDSAYTERTVGRVQEKLVVLLIKHGKPGNWSNAAKCRGHPDALSAD